MTKILHIDWNRVEWTQIIMMVRNSTVDCMNTDGNKLQAGSPFCCIALLQTLEEVGKPNFLVKVQELNFKNIGQILNVFFT